MYEILITLPNSAKLVGLSGTPISGNVNELAVLFNLLLRKDIFDYNTFDVDYTYHIPFVEFDYRALTHATMVEYNAARTAYLTALNINTIRNEQTICDIISPVVSFFDNIKHLMPKSELQAGLTLEGYNNDGGLLYGIDLLDVPAIQVANIALLTGNRFMTDMNSLSSAYTMNPMPPTEAEKIAVFREYKVRATLPRFRFKHAHLDILNRAIDNALADPLAGPANMLFASKSHKLMFFTYHLALYNLIVSSEPIYASIPEQKMILKHLKETNIKFFKVILNILKHPDKRHIVYIEHQRAILPFFKYMQLFCYSEYVDDSIDPTVAVLSPVLTAELAQLQFPTIWLQHPAPVADAEIDTTVDNYNAHIGVGGKKFAFVTGEGNDMEKDILDSYMLNYKTEGKRVMDREDLLQKYKDQGIDVANRRNDLNVVVLNSAGTEGTNFPKTDYIHILELYGNCSKLYQTIARIVRTCAHNLLPKPPGAPVVPGAPIAPCADGTLGNDHCGIVYPILYLTNTDDDRDRYGRLMITQDRFIPYLNMIKKCSIECTATAGGNCLVNNPIYT
jgi:hypothetical protein